jgi:DNA replication protein DnaC
MDTQRIGAILEPQIEILRDKKPNTLSAELDNRGCKCDGQGWYVIFDEEKGVHRHKICICQKVAKTKIGEIPEEFNGRKFTNLKIYQKGWNPKEPEDMGNALALSVAKDFVNNFESFYLKRSGPFFIGKPGRGKTLICSIIFQELCNKNFYPIYLHFRRFLDKLIESYNRQDEGILEKDYFEVIRDADVVVIDELRTTKNKYGQINEWQQDKILKILDTARLVIIDSNYDLAWISENIGEHIASRISAKCGIPIVVGGPDHRQIIGYELQKETIERAREAS